MKIITIQIDIEQLISAIKLLYSPDRDAVFLGSTLLASMVPFIEDIRTLYNFDLYKDDPFRMGSYTYAIREYRSKVRQLLCNIGICISRIDDHHFKLYYDGNKEDLYL